MHFLTGRISQKEGLFAVVAWSEVQVCSAP
jgi:hypothetical protein